MKKLTIERREYLKRKMKYAQGRLLKKSKLYNTRKKIGIRASKKAPALRLYAPSEFSITNDVCRIQLMGFLDSLRHIFVNNSDIALVIDFSKTEKFDSSGTILFYAELIKLIEYGKGRIRLRCTTPANERASQVLEQIGIYKLCSHPSHGSPTREDVVHWRVARGHLIDNSLCAPAIEAFEGQLATPLVDGILSGLGEAMANAVEHAYIGTRDDGLNFGELKDWWMFSQSKDSHLTVVFCDLGVGIPVTLPIKRPVVFRILESLGLSSSDSACIEEAIKESRSRTGNPGRGHGLGEIIDVIEKIPEGLAVVYSNKGSYLLKKGIVTKYDYKTSILGTIICWRLPLDGVVANG